MIRQAPAVENLDYQLDIVRAEEPEVAGVAGQCHRVSEAALTHEVLPLRFDLETFVQQA